MKILLIHPYFTSGPKEFIQVFSEPLGLMSLAAYILNSSTRKVDVRILDLYAMGFDILTQRPDMRLTRGLSDAKKIQDLISQVSPDIIGIHCNFTGYSSDAFEVAAISKAAIPKAVVVMGGAHASYDSESILSGHGCVDYIVRGEGEVTFLELIDAIRDRRGVEDIKGIAYRDKKGNVVLTQNRELVEDIDKFPLPDRKLIDMEKYLVFNKQSFPMAMQYPVATVMASRGCPYDCIFCSTKNMWGRKWRGRSSENIIREIDDLVLNYGVREIAFYDDQFLVNKKWVNEVCDLIISRRYGISLSLPAGTSLWLADANLLKKMRKAGFYRLNFPIESGNKASLKFIRKPIELESVSAIIKLSCQLGFWTSANFIIGFPYETPSQIQETIKFAYNCGIDYPFFFIARPFRGAQMYEIYKKEGLIKDESEIGSSVFVAKSDTIYCTAEELIKIRSDAEKGFLKYKLFWCVNPKNFIGYVLPRICSINGIRYFIKICFSVISGKHKR